MSEYITTTNMNARRSMSQCADPMRRKYLSITISLHILLNHCQALAGKKPILRRIRSVLAPSTLPFYEDGLRFSCTGCGKCCKVDGDVWLAPEEVEMVIGYLGKNTTNNDHSRMSTDDFRREYIRAEVTPSPSDGQDDQPINSWMCLKRNDGACVFLDPLGKCSIYDLRPVQCRTYPFWPSLLKSRADWEEEAVLPDEVTIGEGTVGRHWSPELGGCEGITLGRGGDSEMWNPEALGDNAKKGVDTINLGEVAEGVQPEDSPEIVERGEILSKMRAAKRHWKRFPVQEIKESTWYL